MELETTREIEAHKGVLSLATEAFKYLALANGGAAVALLSKISTDPQVFSPVRALAPFAFGLLCCGGSVLFMLVSEMLVLHRPTETNKGFSYIASCHTLTCLFILASTAFFAYGCGMAVAFFEIATAPK